jgi:nucleotide-binding universal stress UspA family protein
MFRQVLVGVDDDQGGRDAIALGKLLAGADGALTFGHIFHADTSVPWGFQDPTKSQQEDESRQLLERIAGQAGVSAHLRWHGAPSVGRGLHELAEAINADLLVVGSSRRALLGRVRLADDTRAALNAAPCAVAVAPAGYASEPTVVREIGVGYDGSPESERAVAVARALAAEPGTKLSAFQAVPQRVARPARRRVAKLWPGWTAHPRTRLRTPGPHRPVPAARAPAWRRGRGRHAGVGEPPGRARGGRLSRPRRGGLAEPVRDELKARAPGGGDRGGESVHTKFVLEPLEPLIHGVKAQEQLVGEP